MRRTKTTTAPVPILGALGKAAEVASCEILRAAVSRVPKIHADAMKHLVRLPLDLSPLPVSLATMLEELRNTEAGRASAIRARVFKYCPQVADSATALQPANQARAIRSFLHQHAAEVAAQRMVETLTVLGFPHPETRARLSALAAILGLKP